MRVRTRGGRHRRAEGERDREGVWMRIGNSEMIEMVVDMLELRGETGRWVDGVMGGGIGDWVEWVCWGW